MENTICMYQNEIEAGLCPITEIKLMYGNQYENLDTQNYTSEIFKRDVELSNSTDNVWLVYSKTKSDNLPIQST